MSSSGKTRVFGTRIRRFESSHPSQLTICLVKFSNFSSLSLFRSRPCLEKFHGKLFLLSLARHKDFIRLSVIERLKMASKTLTTREGQKGKFLRLAEERKSLLVSQGVDEKGISRDPKVRHLSAKIKQINSAISRICAIEEQTKKLIEKKEQRKAEEAATRAAYISGAVTGKSKKKQEELPKAAPSKKKQPGGGGKAPAKGGKQESKKK